MSIWPGKTEILQPTPKNLVLAASFLKKGEIIGIPTETVYGLAGNALDERALVRIFAAKERPAFDPLIVHIAPFKGSATEHLSGLGLLDAKALSPEAHLTLNCLGSLFWPGPLTLIVPKTKKIPDLATSGLPAVGIRVPRHPLAQQLITLAETPLAAPSANRFGRISPTTAAHVRAELEGRVKIILDGGPCDIGLESTVASISKDGQLKLLRPGGIPWLVLQEALRENGVASEKFTTHADPSFNPKDALKGSLASPGMLESHYAPQKSLALLPSSLDQLSPEALEHALSAGLFPREGQSAKEIGVLIFKGNADAAARRIGLISGHPVIARSLSRTGNLEEAANRLFGALRELDDSSAVFILAEPCPSQVGLGHAIADRLRRASASGLKNEAHR